MHCDEAGVCPLDNNAIEIVSLESQSASPSNDLSIDNGPSVSPSNVSIDVCPTHILVQTHLLMQSRNEPTN